MARFIPETPAYVPDLKDLKGFGGAGKVAKRIKGSAVIYDNRDKIAETLLGMFSATIADVAGWDGEKLSVKPLDEIPPHALHAIKSVTVGKDGLKIELIDRVRVGQLLAKSAGLLSEERMEKLPAIVSVEMVLPKDDGEQ